MEFEIHKNAILAVVLYGCETRSLTLRDDHRLQTLEYAVLRGTCTSKGQETEENWTMKSFIILITFAFQARICATELAAPQGQTRLHPAPSSCAILSVMLSSKV
jgi:hypothetical protein